MGRVRVRTFSLEEANRALPRVRRHVERIVELGLRLSELHDDLAIATYRSGRPGSSEQEQQAVATATDRLRRAEEGFLAALHALEAIGVELKDVRNGLVDFPSVRENAAVELCWRLGEERVAHWHIPGAGHGGRAPLG
jgi:hypothetical protein